MMPDFTISTPDYVIICDAEGWYMLARGSGESAEHVRLRALPLGPEASADDAHAAAERLLDQLGH